METVYLTIRTDVQPERVVGIHQTPDKAWAQMERLSTMGGEQRDFSVEQVASANVDPGLRPNSIIVRSDRGMTLYDVRLTSETRHRLGFYLVKG